MNLFKSIALAFLLCAVSYAADLRIKSGPTPDAVLLAEHPDKGFLRVYSTVSANLEFKCYQGCAEVRPKGGGEYLVILWQGEKNIVVKAAGYSPVTVTLPHGVQAKEAFRVDVEGEDLSGSKGKGNLQINSIPAGALIEVEGVPQVMEYRTPFTFPNMAAMSYQVLLSKDRYLPESFKIEVLRDQTVVKNVELKPAWADVQIHGSAMDLSVRRNNRSYPAPVQFAGERDGFYPTKPEKLLLSAPFYQDSMIELRPNSGEKLDLNVDLKLVAGRIQIQSEPSGLIFRNATTGARIMTPWSDSLALGLYTFVMEQSPYFENQSFNFDLHEAYPARMVLRPHLLRGKVWVDAPAGSEILINGDAWSSEKFYDAGVYKLSIRNPKYSPVEKQFEVNDTLVKVNAGTSLQYSSISVEGRLPGDTLWVDGILRWGDSLKLPVGNREFLLRRKDHADWKRTVLLNQPVQSIRATPQALPGIFNVQTYPSGAQVFIDGKYKGQSPLSLELIEGSYELSLKLRDYASHQEKINIGRNQNLTQNYSLQAYLADESRIALRAKAERNHSLLFREPLFSYVIERPMNDATLQNNAFAFNTTPFEYFGKNWGVSWAGLVPGAISLTGGMLLNDFYGARNIGSGLFGAWNLTVGENKFEMDLLSLKVKRIFALSEYGLGFSLAAHASARVFHWNQIPLYGRTAPVGDEGFYMLREKKDTSGDVIGIDTVEEGAIFRMGMEGSLHWSVLRLTAGMQWDLGDYPSYKTRNYALQSVADQYLQAIRKPYPYIGLGLNLPFLGLEKNVAKYNVDPNGKAVYLDVISSENYDAERMISTEGLDSEETVQQNESTVSAPSMKARQDLSRSEIAVRPTIRGMVSIPEGCFSMGSNDGENDEKPVHRVCLSAYYMDIHEVTQEEFRTTMGYNPSLNQRCGAYCPVEQVDWYTARSYCQKMGKRLPTEAEWEFAARGAIENRGFRYAGSNNADQVAWYDGNSGGEIHPVCTKARNEIGLCDMSGNVWEWVQDWYGEYSYRQNKNPDGPGSGPGRVNRGGGADSEFATLTSTSRDHDEPSRISYGLGFRCAK